MYDPRIIVDLIARNVGKSGNPFGIPPWAVNRWWKELKLPQQGDTVLLTGLMVQFMPLIEQTTKLLEQYEQDRRASWLKHFRIIPMPIVKLGAFTMFTLAGDRRAYEILRSVVALLRISGIRFAYRPELDLYSGILLHDLGDEEGFKFHARRVFDRLVKAGIRTIITIDPHTTYALKVLYPKYFKTSFRVYNYLELLKLDGKKAEGQRVTLHDPCFFGRYLHLSQVPRKLLRDLGVQIAEVRQSMGFTHCCGGPAESVSPELSREIATKRLQQLRETDAPILTMCPICLSNLRRAGGRDIEDLSVFLRRHALS